MIPNHRSRTNYQFVSLGSGLSDLSTWYLSFSRSIYLPIAQYLSARTNGPSCSSLSWEFRDLIFEHVALIFSGQILACRAGPSFTMDLLPLRCVLSVELYGKLTGISALLMSDFRVAFWEKVRRLAHVNNNGAKTRQFVNLILL